MLHRSRSHDAFAAELIDDALASANLSPQDRRFVTQLVFGVIRRRGTLDALLKPFIKIPMHAVQPRVWDVLHLGAFQLAFLTHVPKHAAVNETVELATHVGSPKAKGFVNGVMRRVAELVTDEFTDKPGADAVPFDCFGARGVSHPLTRRRRSPLAGYRKLARPILPDPVTAPDAYFAAAFSLPKWLADRWLGPLRPRRMHATRLLVQRAAAAVDSHQQAPQRSRDVSPPPRGGAHRRRDRRTPAVVAIARTATRSATCPATTTGDFAVQDHSSMLVASALGVQPGMHVLDLCSAPGGKTTHLAELMDNRGRVDRVRHRREAPGDSDSARVSGSA